MNEAIIELVEVAMASFWVLPALFAVATNGLAVTVAAAVEVAPAPPDAAHGRLTTERTAFPAVVGNAGRRRADARYVASR